MAKYETMLVTTATLDEEATAALDWGKRRLAYPINKENEGVYTLINFTSEADFPAELDRVYKITDGVLRSMIVAKEEAVPAKAETEAK